MKKQKEKRHMLRTNAARIIMAAIMLAAASAIIVVAVFKGTIKPIDLADKTTGNENPEKTTQTTAIDPEKIGVAVKNQRADTYTFLITGIDADSMHTDVIMLVTLDIKAKTANVLSIPRDTMINGKQKGAEKKINAAYSREDGIKATIAEVKKITGIEANRYAVTTFTGFEKIVDAIGGVWYDVPIDMKHADNDKNTSINLKAGPQRIDGKKALQIVRFRERFYADIGRIGRTQDFLKVVAQQLIKSQNIVSISKIISVLLTEAKTDMTAGELIWLYNSVKSLPDENLHFHTLPGEGEYVQNVSYYIADPEKTIELVNESMNPYDEVIEEESFDMVKPPYKAY